MARSVEIPLPEVFEPLLRPSRYKGLYGGRGSAKSHAFGDLLIDDALTHSSMRAVCVREYQVSLEQSVKRLLEDKIKAYGLSREFRVLDSHIETPGDGIIIFQGMQSHNAESIKSLEGYDRLWIEEAQNISQRSLDLIRPTIREEGSEIWASWNPRHRTDPIEELLRHNPPPGAVVIRSSYRDNPFFPEVLRREMEWDRSRDPEKYAHVWLGEYEKHSSSRVFKNWKVVDFETPDDTSFMMGADWGFSADPSTLTRCYLKDERTLRIDRECYKIGVEIDDLPKLFDGLACGCDYESPRPCRFPQQHGMARNFTIRADSARPETISYMQRHGYPRLIPAIKGPNSVAEGVKFLQGYNIEIHSRCTHTVDEFTMYSYKVDPRTEKVIEPAQLEDKKNHVIDPTRYAVEELRNLVASFVSW